MMTFVKWSAITAGLVAAFGVGVWSAPHFQDRAPVDWRSSMEVNAPVAQQEIPLAPAPEATRVKAVVVRNITTFAPMETAVATSSPELHARMKGVLRSGANMDIAANGFQSAEQFAMVAHAARNVDVPFMLLKHRVLDEGDTLVAAIRKSRNDVDAIVEADRARAEARSDLSSLKYEMASAQ
jgi:hypothetical protein